MQTKSARQSATLNGKGNAQGTADAIDDNSVQTGLTARAEVRGLGGCPSDCDEQGKKDVRTSDEHRSWAGYRITGDSERGWMWGRAVTSEASILKRSGMQTELISHLDARVNIP